MRADLDDHFDVDEQVELGVGLGLFHGFSKMLIALGVEPEDMDTTVIETPSPAGVRPRSAPTANRYIALFESRSDLADRWHAMTEELRAVEALEPAVLDAVRSRVATLIGVEWAAVREHPDPEDAATIAMALEIAELFVIDVRQLATGTFIDQFRERVGERALVQMIMTLAIFDGIYRYAACRGPAQT